MTADGYDVEVAMALRPIERRRIDPSREWQERHADLAATLRTILAMCEQPGIVLSSGTHLARSIREVIEGAIEWPGR